VVTGQGVIAKRRFPRISVRQIEAKVSNGIIEVTKK
jgi:hypothetical protein